MSAPPRTLEIARRIAVENILAAAKPKPKKPKPPRKIRRGPSPIRIKRMS